MHRPTALPIVRTLVVLAAPVVLWIVGGLLARAETITVVRDDFERGGFSADWSTTHGEGTAVVHKPGGGAGGSDRYARVEGVAANQGGLGVSLGDAFRDSFATDFTIAFDFMVDDATGRQLCLHVSAAIASPSVGSPAINLRYEGGVGGAWAAYTTAWNTISDLGSVAPGTWNRLVLSGKGWGSGVGDTASYDIELTNHLGEVTSVTGLKLYQGTATAPDTGGARSMNFNDAYGNNPGFLVDNVTVTATGTSGRLVPVDPVARSGIYPHLAVSNGTGSESGIGAVMDWAGQIWYMTYPAHSIAGSPDKLHSFGAELARTTYPKYPGSTNANRYLDAARQRMFIGSAIVDAEGRVRALPVAREGDLRGRLTGTGPHLTDPNKVYYMTMEEGFYEVDLSDLDAPVITTLRVDGNVGAGSDRESGNLPGRHGKGFYVAQGHVFFTNNGDGGCLVEWNGKGDPAMAESWTVIDRNKYNEVTTRNGVAGNDPRATDPVWAVGWDHRSVLLNVRDAETGRWTRYRLPKGSYTHDHEPGHYTEWPRIRDAGLEGGNLLMNEHGLMFLFPAGLRAADVGGVTPFATFHKMIVDYVAWGDRIVMACNDCSPFAYPLHGRSHSNLMFVEKDALGEYGGRPTGFGGPWVRDAVAAGEPSEAFLVAGFSRRTLHLAHREAESVEFTIEIDAEGKGKWTVHKTVTVGPDGYGYAMLPADLDAQWIRVKAGRDVAAATAYLHLANPQRAADAAMTASLAKAGAPAARSQGLLLTHHSPSFPLQLAADVLAADGSIAERGFYHARLDDELKLEIVPVDDAAAETAVRDEAATTQDFGVDDASVYIDHGGARYRLPKGHAAFDAETASGPRRGKREVVTERAVMNIHGAFYELPRDSSGGIRRIRPITTHNLDIFDYVSWRGMLVLSGNLGGAAEDEHYVASNDGKVGLWFGNVDDLWRFGAPAGVGGPWKDTPVEAGKPSDPYLMFGYDRKRLELSHDADAEVTFTIQVDVLGNNTWETFGRLTAAAGETLEYDFPDGYSAHWIRLVADRNVKATAQLIYEPAR